MKRILIAALLLLVAASAWANARYMTDKDGLQHWIGVSSDTKPTPTSTPLIPIGSTYYETDTRLLWIVDKTGNWISGGNPVNLPEALGGERNIGSRTGTDHMAVAGEWNDVTIATNATGDIAVPGCTGPSLVRQVMVRRTNDSGTATVATVGTVIVKDGSVVKDGAATSTAAGTVIYDGGDGSIFKTSVVVAFSSASDNPSSSGKVKVQCRPLDASKVTWMP